MTPTYDKLLQDIQSAGVNFSDYDLQLAQQNPQAGYGILQAKIDYSNATTPEAQALAHQQGEMWRSQGSYSGGGDGGAYIPIYQGIGNGQLDAKTQQLTNAPSFSYGESPTFADEYKGRHDAALDKVLNYGDFSYDYKTDPLYGQYKQAYTREGQRATADALGQAAALSGGLASSYATSAAAQAGNYYAAQMADKIPELYQMAYQQYADQFQRNVTGYNSALAARNFDLDRYSIADLGRYQNDRDFAYRVYSDDQQRLLDQINVLTQQDQLAYQRQQDALAAALRGSGGGGGGGSSGNSLPAPEEPTTPAATKPYDFSYIGTRDQAVAFANSKGANGNEILTEAQFNAEKNKKPVSEAEFNRDKKLKSQYSTYQEYRKEVLGYSKFNSYYDYLQTASKAYASGALR